MWWSLPGSLLFSVVLLRPTPSQRDGSAISCGHASHERYTVCNVEGREINLHRPITCAPGLNPGPPRDSRTCHQLRYCNPPLWCYINVSAYIKQSSDLFRITVFVIRMRSVNDQQQSVSDKRMARPTAYSYTPHLRASGVDVLS